MQPFLSSINKQSRQRGLIWSATLPVVWLYYDKLCSPLKLTALINGMSHESDKLTTPPCTSWFCDDAKYAWRTQFFINSIVSYLFSISHSMYACFKMLTRKITEINLNFKYFHFTHSDFGVKLLHHNKMVHHSSNKDRKQ